MGLVGLSGLWGEGGWPARWLLCGSKATKRRGLAGRQRVPTAGRR